MSDVLVAPRELHDLVYRASRIAGVDAGRADRLAANVTFAEIHHRRSVSGLTVALTRAGTAALLDFARAADVVLSAEVETQRTGQAVATFERPMPFLAVAATVRETTVRGALPTDLPSPLNGASVLASLRLEIDPPTDGLWSSIEPITVAAHRHGIAVDGRAFAALERAARGFLVAEATLDRVDG